MKTNTTCSAPEIAESTLGWNAMPHYGEVMTQLIGMKHTDVVSTLKVSKTPVLASLWSLLSSHP